MSEESLQRLSSVPWFLVSPPETSPDDLLREELSDAIESSVNNYPLTIIEAPSGFGKTRSLAMWAKSREGSTAWITLRRDSRTPDQILPSIMGALLRLYPDSPALKSVLVWLQDGYTDLQSTIGAIIDAMPDGTQTTVVIDEAQESSREGLADLIVPLGQYSGGKLRFIISGTQSLRRWMTKQIAKGEARQIPATDFLFSPDEVAELISRTSSSGSKVADQLWQETGGWPIGVQLLIQIGADSHTPADLRAHMSPNILADYIETEVLSALRPELREFILDAVVCERLSLPLASHLVDHLHVASLLEECQRKGLFLDRFNQEGEGPLYRWHGTFARSCREIAERTDPERYYAIHRRAADWMAERYPAEAIYHALQTSEPGFAVEMIENVWLQLITSGRATVLETRCHQLPPSVEDSPSILYIRAACRDMVGDHDSARMLMTRAHAALDKVSGAAAQRVATARVFACLMILSDHTDLENALEEAEQLLSDAALSRSQYIHGTFLTGWTRMRLRTKPAKAIGFLSAAAESAEKAGYKTVARRASATSAFALAFSGRLNQAKQILEGLSNREESQGFDPFDGSMNHWSSVFISYWQGDMARAMEHARKLDSTSGPVSSNAGMGRIYFACAAGLAGQDELDEADELLERVSDKIQHGIPWPLYKAVASATVHWARGNHSAAVEALDIVRSHSGITTTLAMAADLWRRLGYPQQALRMIDLIDPRLLASYTTASVGFTRAVIAWNQGEKNETHRLLSASLEAAVPQDICAPFTNLDDSARALLTDHMARGTVHETFIAQRLTADSTGRTAANPESEPLSAREAEVFSYLGTTMTAVEIAEALFVSPATVRSHQRAIYRKLNVTNRRDAVRAGNRTQKP